MAYQMSLAKDTNSFVCLLCFAVVGGGGCFFVAGGGGLLFFPIVKLFSFNCSTIYISHILTGPFKSFCIVYVCQ